MPQARNIKERVSQIVGWLQANHPAPWPVDVRWRKMLRYSAEEYPQMSAGDRNRGFEAECYSTPQRRIRIDLSERVLLRSWSNATHTLLHEWAHAVVIRPLHVEYRRSEHPDEWGLAYAKIYRDFFDRDGWLESRDF